MLRVTALPLLMIELRCTAEEFYANPGRMYMVYRRAGVYRSILFACGQTQIIPELRIHLASTITIKSPDPATATAFVEMH